MPRRPLHHVARVSFRNPLILALLACSMLTSSVQAQQMSSQPASADRPARIARSLIAPDNGLPPMPVPQSGAAAGTGHGTDQRHPARPMSVAPTGQARARLVAGYGQLPLSFERNVGQVDRRVAFIARGAGYTLYLTATGATLALWQPSNKKPGSLADGGRGRRGPIGHGAGGTARSAHGTPATCGVLGGTAVRGLAGGCLPGALGGLARGGAAPVRESVVSLRYVGASAHARIAGAARLLGIVNYLIGKDPKGWHTRIPTYARVVYRDVYPGIDLAYYGHAGSLEYDWVVRPGADVARIRMAVGGAGGAQLDRRGDLLLGGRDLLLRQAPPAIYQLVHGVRHPVAGGYMLLGHEQVGFRVHGYDRGAPLVIDPVLLTSTLLGGEQPDFGTGIAVDGLGEAVVTGWTNSSLAFPTTPTAYQKTRPGGTLNAFVAKMSADGTMPVYVTYLGGASQDGFGTAVAVDPTGNAYVTGYTGDAKFPIIIPAYKATNPVAGANYETFITELDKAGATVLHSTFLGDGGTSEGYGIAWDSTGVYVTGLVNSFLDARQICASGCTGAGGDAFVAKLSLDLVTLSYGVRIGGGQQDAGNAIALDAGHAAYVTGTTQSADFPTAGGPAQPASGGGGDAFVCKVDPAGTSLAYSTYLGGPGADTGNGIAVSGGNAYVTGATGSASGFATAGTLQPGYGGGTSDAYVAEIPTGGGSPAYVTYLGGTNADQGNAIAVDGAGDAYVAGTTGSATFPTTDNAFSFGDNEGNNDAFVTELNPTGTADLFSSYLGGPTSQGGGSSAGSPSTAAEAGTGIALDGAGAVYLVGSGGAGFPITPHAYQTPAGTNPNVVIAKLSLAGGGQPGQIPWHPHYTVALSDRLAARVDLADGHVDISSADLALPGFGPGLDFTRTWDSTLAGADLPAGQGWTSSMAASVRGSLTGKVLYQDASGARWIYRYLGQPTDPGPTYTTYLAPPGVPWQLSATLGSGYTLTNILTGAVRRFDASGALVSDADSYGNNDTLSPAGTAATRLIDNGARALTFVPNGSGQLSDVESAYWVSSGGLNGQHAQYSYTPVLNCANGQLCAITWGQGTADTVTASFQYDASSRLTGVTTPNGNVWTLTYNTTNQLTGIASAAVTGPPASPAIGTTITYPAGMAVVTAGATSGHPLLTTYTLDGSGQATQVQDGTNHSSSYVYDANHGVTKSTDRNGNPTMYTYQPAVAGSGVDLLTQVVGPGINQGQVTGGTVGTTTVTYSYDPLTNDLLEMDDLSTLGVTHYTYDSQGGVPRHRVLTTVQLYGSLPCGGQAIRQAVATFTPTPTPSGADAVRPLCLTTYSWRGTINTYNGRGQLTNTAYGPGVLVTGGTSPSPAPTAAPSGATGYSRAYGYDPQGDLQSAQASAAAGTVTSSATFDADGNPLTATSPNNQAAGASTVYVTNHLGRPTKATLPSTQLGGTGGTAQPVWQRSYYGDGEPKQTTDPLGHARKYAYDPWGRPLTSADQNGNKTSWAYDGFTLKTVTDPRGHATTYTPDADGRVASVVAPAGDGTHDPGSLVQGTLYDAVGNPTQVTLGGATPIRTEASQYDAQNNLVRQDTSGPGLGTALTTRYAPDGDGRVAQVQAPNGDLTTYSYDPASERSGTAFQPAGGGLTTEGYRYDSFGNLQQHTSWLGQQHTVQVDPLGRPTAVTDGSAMGGPVTITTNPAFDLDGNLTAQLVSEQVASPSATPTLVPYSYAATYNAADWRLGSNDAGLQTGYGYDKLGRLTTLTLPLPAPTGTALTDTVAYTLDSGGRATGMAEGVAGTPTAVATFAYNQDDQLTREVLPGPVTATATIDNAGRLIALGLAGPPAALVLSSSYDYHYDLLGRTTQVNAIVNGTAVAIVNVTPDAAGRLLGAGVAGTPVAWDYDGGGNLQHVRTNGVQTAAYGYDAASPEQLDSVAVQGTPTIAYSQYDANGDPGLITSGGSPTSLTYDSRGRIQGFFANAGSALFTYNATGQRTQAAWYANGGTSPGYTLRYGYRGGQLAQLAVAPLPSPTPSGTPAAAPECRTADVAGCTESFVYRQDGGPLELLYTPAGGATQRYWYELDGRGSVVALTDQFGSVVDRYQYDVWGVPGLQGDHLHAALETVPQPLRYRGYVYDRELTGHGEASGWYWLGVRSYDPNIGRFIQPDPSEQEGTRSYVYCGDAPLDCSDPSCLLSLEDVGSWAHNTPYNAAQGAAGGLDFLSFGAYAHVAGAFGARVDTGSTAYQVGYWATGAVLAVKGAVSLGARVLARSGAAGAESAATITIYRGTQFGAELAIHGDSGYLLSDAARQSYAESRLAGGDVGGALQAAKTASEAAHGAALDIWGTESEYAQAHAAFGTEYTAAFGARSLLSFTRAFHNSWRGVVG